MIRIVVADDHPIVRDGLRALFESLPDVEVVGEASTGREAIRCAVEQRPDVLVIDLGMPDVDVQLRRRGEDAFLSPVTDDFVVSIRRS